MAPPNSPEGQRHALAELLATLVQAWEDGELCECGYQFRALGVLLNGLSPAPGDELLTLADDVLDAWREGLLNECAREFRRLRELLAVELSPRRIESAR